MRYITTEELITATRNAWDKEILICQHPSKFSFSDYKRDSCVCAIGSILTKEDIDFLEGMPCDSIDYLAEEGVVSFEDPEFAAELMKKHDAVVEAKEGPEKIKTVSQFKELIQR